MADKSIVVYDLPPNYVSIAMLRERWVKGQERKKKGEEERNRTKQTDLQESETIIQAGESVVPALEGTEKERMTEIKEAKKKKKWKKTKARKEREKKGEDSVKDKVARDEHRAAVISEKTNGPAGGIAAKWEIVPKGIARGGENVKQNHKEKEKGSGVRYVKKEMMPSAIVPKSQIVREGGYFVEEVARRVDDLTLNYYRKGRSTRTSWENKGSGDYQRRKSGENEGRGGYQRRTSWENKGRGGYQRRTSWENEGREGYQRRTSWENEGRGGYRRRTNVQTAWVRKGEATGSIGVLGAG